MAKTFRSIEYIVDPGVMNLLVLFCPRTVIMSTSAFVIFQVGWEQAMVAAEDSVSALEPRAESKAC
jgi:hypothetical protein